MVRDESSSWNASGEQRSLIGLIRWETHRLEDQLGALGRSDGQPTE